MGRVEGSATTMHIIGPSERSVDFKLKKVILVKVNLVYQT